jgi:hypothetical protein
MSPIPLLLQISFFKKKKWEMTPPKECKLHCIYVGPTFGINASGVTYCKGALGSVEAGNEGRVWGSKGRIEGSL